MKSFQQKINGCSKMKPLTSKNVADQIELLPEVGLPEPLPFINEDPEVEGLYYKLGNALMRYTSLYQDIDSFELSIAAHNLSMYLEYVKVITEEGSFLKEAKSHTAIDPDTGKMPVTIKPHPAIKMKRDAQSDFEKSMKMLGLDLKGRAAIFAQMSMVKAIYGKQSTTNIYENFMNHGIMG